MDESGTLTAQEFADAVGYSRLALLRVLQRDLELPVSERRLPGAYHTNMANRRRGEWRIPSELVDTFERRERGRPRKTSE